MTRCPRCYEPAPCHRCVDPVRIEAGWASWLAGIGFVVMLAVWVMAV